MNAEKKISTKKIFFWHSKLSWGEFMNRTTVKVQQSFFFKVTKIVKKLIKEFYYYLNAKT